MTSLLEPLRQIGRDLIAKRLWPIAVMLLAALVIVPMLIGGSSEDAPAPATTTAPVPAESSADGPGAAGKPAANARHARSGKVSNPFYDPPQASATPAGAPEAGAADPTRAVADPPSDTGAASADTSTAKPSPAPSSTPPATATTRSPTRAAAPPRPSFQRAIVRWGASRRAESRAIARLTPLGGRANPAALYLGVTKPGPKYAVFVLGANATSRGDGACRAGTDCRMIALRAGETRRFTVRSPDDGTSRTFVLTVRSLPTIVTSARAARRARARVHPDGRSVLHAMWRSPAQAAVIGWASYDKRAGLLRAAADRRDVEKPAE